MDLEVKEFSGSISITTPTGIRSLDLAFNLILNPEVDIEEDPVALKCAVETMGLFLARAYLPTLEEDDFNPN